MRRRFPAREMAGGPGRAAAGEGGGGAAAGLPVALVLGAAVGPGGLPSPALRGRALHAAGLVLAGRAGHLLACGGARGPGPAEAAVIAALARAAGVPDGRISCEDRSRTTEENLAFARPILAGLGDPPVVIVTDRFHARRALLIAAAMGLAATADCPEPGATPPLRRLRNALREALARARVRWRRARGCYRSTTTSIECSRPPSS